jgi:hypothetical protein
LNYSVLPQSFHPISLKVMWRGTTMFETRWRLERPTHAVPQSAPQHPTIDELCDSTYAGDIPSTAPIRPPDATIKVKHHTRSATFEATQLHRKQPSCLSVQSRPPYHYIRVSSSRFMGSSMICFHAVRAHCIHRCFVPSRIPRQTYAIRNPMSVPTSDV